VAEVRQFDCDLESEILVVEDATSLL